jgi:ribosomal protein L37E
MARKGWWKQLQSGDYPKTQLNYGDADAANFRPSIKKDNLPEDKEPPIKLQEECPECGRLYWTDKKKCPRCGWPHEKVVKETPVSSKITPNCHYTVLCPKCGSKMVLRIARKGEYANQKFWGCSKYPQCRAISPYVELK